jgi:hypothetical protein
MDAEAVWSISTAYDMGDPSTKQEGAMALTLRPIEPERCAGEMTYYVWGDDGSAALRFVIPKLEFAAGCGINRVGLDEFLARQSEIMAACAAAYERRKRRLKVSDGKANISVTRADFI